jgi:hypothetical protein
MSGLPTFVGLGKTDLGRRRPRTSRALGLCASTQQGRGNLKRSRPGQLWPDDESRAGRTSMRKRSGRGRTQVGAFRRRTPPESKLSPIQVLPCREP